jgi:hypothetical protein
VDVNEHVAKVRSFKSKSTRSATHPAHEDTVKTPFGARIGARLFSAAAAT